MKISSLLALPLIWSIHAYQLLLSPLFAGACRFEPSCSKYAQGALREHGAFVGSMLAVRRIFRCHPWNPGGIDPVPPTKTSKVSQQIG